MTSDCFTNISKIQIYEIECCYLHKGPFLYYVRLKGWVGGIAKYLLFLTGVGGWVWITLTQEKKITLNQYAKLTGFFLMKNELSSYHLSHNKTRYINVNIVP
jgi:hypothetical protein